VIWLRLATAVAAALLALVACDSGGAGTPQAAEPTTLTLPAPTSGPYVTVAVDNHFHDIHPDDHIEISSDRAFMVVNQGHNLHNFSVAGSDISHDIRPGDEFALRPVKKFLDPGTYQIFCKYHADQGMVGEITIVP
jgi:hypothetical protein